MAKGGYRKNSGRKKGGHNKSTTERSRRISDLAKAWSDEALDTLVYHMRNKKKTPELSLRASETILAYAYGKPIQAAPDGEPGDAVTTIVIRGGLPI